MVAEAFDSTPVRWSRERVTGVTGFDVTLDHNMSDRLISVDRDEGMISLRPGQTLYRLGALLTMATWDILGGPDWTPGFRRLASGPLTIAPSNGEPVTQSNCCAHCRYRVVGNAQVPDIRSGILGRHRRIVAAHRVARDELIAARDNLGARRRVRRPAIRAL